MVAGKNVRGNNHVTKTYYYKIILLGNPSISSSTVKLSVTVHSLGWSLLPSHFI